ncbi:MAG: DNA-binding response regulator, partial [Acidobacteria bacterium]|nr:DNA-binding response regulator [Acidobacteriota bacterium]
IAGRLGITDEGVRYHLRNIYRKTGTTSRAEALRCAKSLRVLT